MYTRPTPIHKQIIEKQKERIWHLCWKKYDFEREQYIEVPKSKIVLNFNILVGEFKKKINSKNNPLFMHWQAKPKGLRRWGIYDINRDIYFSRSFDKVEFNNPVPLELIQGNDNAIKENPVSVVLMDAVIEYNQEEESLIRINGN